MNANQSSRPGHVVTRIILPVVLFMFMIAGIAWSIQYLNLRPTPVEPIPNITTKDEPKDDLIKFASLHAVWGSKGMDFPGEFERNGPGHYEYQFENVSGKDVEMGFHEKNCDCQSVDVALVQGTLSPEKLTWSSLAVAGKDKIDVPTGALGYVRINWKNERFPVGTEPLLRVKVWFQPKGRTPSRQIATLDTRIAIAQPLMLLPDKERIDMSEKETRTFTAWSATRDNFDLVLQDSAKHPNIEVDIKEMTAEERTRFQGKLIESGIKSRPKAAFKITATVYDDLNGHLLDQGYFQHYLGLELRPRGKNAKDASTELLLVDGPLLQISLRGDVTVLNPEDPGKIGLGVFSANRDHKKQFTLQSPAETELKLVKWVPNTMKVTLEKSKEGSNASRTFWNLEVTVPADSIFGPFGEEAAIILQTPQSRKIRIPVVGTASR